MANPVNAIVGWLSEVSLVFAVNRQNWKSAIKHADRALLLKPDDADILGIRGVALLSLNKYEQAIADFSRALHLRPTADTYINRAIAYRDIGEFERSIADCDEALKLRPQDISIYVEKAQTYRESEDFELAIENYKTAIARDDAPDFYRPLAETQAEAGDWEGALQTWQQAFDMIPDDPATYFSRGKAYAQRGDMQSAHTDFESALHNAYPRGIPTQANAAPLIAYLAVTHEARGEQDKANDLWRMLLKINPNYSKFAWVEAQKLWQDWMLPHVETILNRINRQLTTTND